MHQLPAVVAPQRIAALRIWTHGMTRHERRRQCADVGHLPAINGAPNGTSVCLFCGHWETLPWVDNEHGAPGEIRRAS